MRWHLLGGGVLRNVLSRLLHLFAHLIILSTSCVCVCLFLDYILAVVHRCGLLGLGGVLGCCVACVVACVVARAATKNVAEPVKEAIDDVLQAVQKALALFGLEISAGFPG